MATVNQTSSNLSGNDSRSVCNPWQLWLKLCRMYNRWIETFFSGLGGLVAKYPLLVIFLCFLIMGSLASGLAFMKIENRTEKLYIPQNSKSISNLNKAESYGFYRPSRNTEVILLSHAGTNVLTEQCFQDALALHELVTNIPGFIKLCLPITQGVHPVVSSQCSTEEPLRIFNYSSNDFKNILDKLNESQISKSVVLDRVFGKISRDPSGLITSAKAIRLVYYMKGFSLDADISEEITDWEREFLNAIKGLNRSSYCGEIFYTTRRSIDDSIAESTGSDIKLIVVTFTVMISFACFMLGKYLNPLTGHGLLAMSGVSSVAFGIMAGFGLSMYTQAPYVSIVGILPFLIIGVGIDDMFIIVDELDRVHPDQTIPKRLGMVMRRVGPAITMTTMTDLLAFAVGTTSIFPSVVYFCTYAALSMAFAFFFLVTIFVAFMTYDCKRMNAGRRDMVPCLRVPASWMGNRRWDEPQTSNKIMRLWGKLLMKPVVKGLVIILSTCLLGIGIYGTTFINEEFDRRDLAKDGSEFIKFLDASEAYFTEDIKVDIILESGVNYADFYTQEKVRNLSNIVENNRFYRPVVVSWLTEFLKNSASNGVSTNSTNFFASLQAFLDSYPKFRSDVVFSTDNSSIVSSRLYCFIKQSTRSVTLRDAMITLRDDFSKKSDLPVFTSAYSFIFFEQFVSTLPETIRNLILAAVAISVVTSLFLVNPIVVFLVLLGFVSLIFELLGLMYIWGVSLNSISMINLVMAIGFAVDYSAHIAHAFVFSRETSPEEKVIQALGTVGASVFMGGFSTFLGMIVTAFASSQIFRIFFKMFFGIVVLGLLHGLCFLPVWLTIFCRHHIDVGIVEQSVSHNPATMSALDNRAISVISENHEKSVCNPVMNSNGALAVITASGMTDSLNNKIPLSSLKTNSDEHMSGSENLEIQPSGELSTSCPEFNTDGPIHGIKIDRTSSKITGDHENSRFNSVINSDKIPASNESSTQM